MTSKIVSIEEAGMTLLQFLRKKHQETRSVKALKKAIDQKFCTVNGRVEIFSSHVLSRGDLVVLEPSAFEKSPPIKFTILYEDEEILIVNKPPGVVCEQKEFSALLGKPFYLVHRLDKETSGALLLAKNEEMKEALIELFKQKAMHKKYLAIVDGAVTKEQGKIENFLGKVHAFKGQTVYGVVGEKNGKKAITAWKRLAKGKNASVLLCEPITGRTHQLRVHLSWMGHPILGDTQYGKKIRCPLTVRRHLLHAYSLTFVHPKKQKEIKAIAPIPRDFKEALTSLKVSISGASSPVF